MYIHFALNVFSCSITSTFDDSLTLNDLEHLFKVTKILYKFMLLKSMKLNMYCAVYVAGELKATSFHATSAALPITKGVFRHNLGTF